MEGGTAAVHGPGGAPAATITVHDDRFWPAVLRRGSVGLGQAYADAWFESDDLADLVHLLRSTSSRSGDRSITWPTHSRRSTIRPRRSRGRETDRSHVAAHYDLSNDFFSFMLDPTMAYSCALFDDPAASLEAAQRAKFDRVCDLLDLTADDHLLEIGTGWGGLALHAASTRGCRVTTTTISADQHEHTRKRVAELDLQDRIEVLDADYRDLDGTYDKVVSIEMIEAVDWRDHAAFFSTLAERLRPGGRAALQAIVIDDRSYERAKRHSTSSRPRSSPADASRRSRPSSARLATPACSPSRSTASASTTPRPSAVAGEVDAHRHEILPARVRRPLPADLGLLPAVLHRLVRSPPRRRRPRRPPEEVTTMARYRTTVDFSASRPRPSSPSSLTSSSPRAIKPACQ